MLVFSDLGRKGNCGNQLFQIASTMGIAIKNGHEFAFPKWEYAAYFDYDFPLYHEQLRYQMLQEKAFHYEPIALSDGDYDLNGWFQSEKYFDKEAVRACFKFKPEIISEVRARYKAVLSQKHILISVRRGDFVHHPSYFQLDYSYYFLGIVKNFPDWKESILIFTSDDIDYCKRHFQFLPNALFIEKSTVIEQLALGSLCNDFVISNSTFSWWLAWLGEKEGTKIVRPIQNYRGKYRTLNDDKDYFPDRWFAFNSQKETMPLPYWKLVLKGEVLKAIDHITYYYRFLVKVKKWLIKKITSLVKGPLQK